MATTRRLRVKSVIFFKKVNVMRKTIINNMRKLNVYLLINKIKFILQKKLFHKHSAINFSHFFVNIKENNLKNITKGSI